jgi:ribose 5-phosphate isomerase RpiB
MSRNGASTKHSESDAAFVFSGRVLTAEDVRVRLNGHREVVLSRKTIVTPLALDDLRAKGVRITRGDEPKVEAVGSKSAWGYAQDRPNGVAQSAVQALKREGLELRELSASASAEPCRWAQALAECVVRGECRGGIVFCDDPGLVCCVGNKLPGLRAAAVVTVSQAARAVLNIGANLVAVEAAGRTFHELRQILRTVCTANASCPDGLACTLKELDGHAHR